MSETERGDSAQVRSDERGKSRRAARTGWPWSLGLLVFGFGSIAGFLLAVSGLELVQEWTGIFLIVCLSVLIFIAATGLILFIFHKPLLRRLFGFAQTQLELFSEPLTEVARGAIERDAGRTTDAAQDLVAMVLARYSWVTTRKWIIGSLTALIAAMAALAGTAMLFQQNVLLEEQSRKIDSQIILADQSVQLAEAARNAGLVAEIINIAEELGATLEEKQAKKGGGRNTVPVLDPETELTEGLISRILAASFATKPYRYLDFGYQSTSNEQALVAALAERKDEFPWIWERLPEHLRFDPRVQEPRLISRPQSPEKGQLLSVLTSAGVREYVFLNNRGLDLSFADARGIKLLVVSFSHGVMRFADLSFATVRESDFAGSFLDNIKFRSAQFRDVSFASIDGADAKPPFTNSLARFMTFLSGADFYASYHYLTDFSGVNALFANFDKSLLVKPKFGGAFLSGTSFRGAALIDPDFAGATIDLVDFDGALVLGADFLDKVAADSAYGFKREIYSLREITDTERTDLTGIRDLPEGTEVLGMIGERAFFAVVRNGELRLPEGARIEQ